MSGPGSPAAVRLAAAVFAKTHEIQLFKRDHQPDRAAVMAMVAVLTALKAEYAAAAGEPYGSKAKKGRQRKLAAAQVQQLRSAESAAAVTGPDDTAARGVAADGAAAAAGGDRTTSGVPPGTVCLEEQEADRVYSTTANPADRANVGLYRNRFRPQGILVDDPATALTCVSQQQQFRDMYANTDWPEQHRHLLDDMDVVKFTIDRTAQHLLHNLQVRLIDELYSSFGKTGESWDGYTLMFRSWGPSKDERKPVTELFQEYCEEIYRPIIFAMLFGVAGWAEVSPFWEKFKSCTIKVMDNTTFYRQNIFHMHIDGKVGILDPKDHAQRHYSRFLFSIVTDALDAAPEETDDPLTYGTTVYPLWQPKTGFNDNHEYHKYMHEWYRDRGLENSGLPRPHYEIPEDLTYRAKTGASRLILAPTTT